MASPFFVYDTADKTLSWDAQAEACESFRTEKAALKRASELARLAPGQKFLVLQTKFEVVNPVAPEVDVTEAG